VRRAPRSVWRAVALAFLVSACSAAPPPASVSAPDSPSAARTPSGLAEAPLDGSPDPWLEQAGDAGQAIVVTAHAYGSTTATFSAYERDGTRWRAVLGPWVARIGNKGFAPPGEKVEGDGRTPSGVYGFGFFFGVAPDPGVRFEYRQVPDDSIVWDEDPASPTYNLWIDLDDFGGGRDPEGMYPPVAYRQGAVIAYNTARTPGLGSGIFLHVSTERPTAGCVSLPVGQLVQVLRWLDPARSPRIIMGVRP
jgi:L,D-peptidoglycan transpeptidase YkuD (ErfK/YbiS/YcfS/YnhG family)